jgi:hypothetical protein
VIVPIVAGAVEVGAGAVSLVPERVLQTASHVQPEPEGRPNRAEGQIHNFDKPTAIIWTAGERIVQRGICCAADRGSSSGQAPGVVVVIRHRCIEAPHHVMGVVGEPERFAVARRVTDCPVPGLRCLFQYISQRHSPRQGFRSEAIDLGLSQPSRRCPRSQGESRIGSAARQRLVPAHAVAQRGFADRRCARIRGLPVRVMVARNLQ